MVVLSEEAPEDFTPERLSGAYRRLALTYGMPIDWSERIRVAPSVHACRAVVATRLRWPEHEAAMLRRLRVLNFAGELLDDSDTLELAAEQAGLPVDELAEWAAAPEVEEALRADMEAARSPSPASRAQDYKLGGPDGGAALHVPLLRAAARHRPARRLADRARASTCPASARSRPTRRRSPTSRPSSPADPIRRPPRRCSSGRACRWPPPRSPP